MRKWFAVLLLAAALALSGCTYWVVEDAPVQVGSADRLPEGNLLG